MTTWTVTRKYVNCFSALEGGVNSRLSTGLIASLNGLEHQAWRGLPALVWFSSALMVLVDLIVTLVALVIWIFPVRFARPVRNKMRGWRTRLALVGTRLTVIMWLWHEFRFAKFNLAGYLQQPLMIPTANDWCGNYMLLLLKVASKFRYFGRSWCVSQPSHSFFYYG